jgi:hypothetical protein
MVHTVRVPHEGLQGGWVLYRVQLDGVVPAAAQEEVPPLHVPAEAATLQGSITQCTAVFSLLVCCTAGQCSHNYGML